jgi:hypothetical protein
MTRRPAILAAVLVAMVLGVAAAGAAEQVTVERESRLYAEPRLDAQEVAVLAPGVVADIAGKSGARLNVRTPSAAGWVFSFNVRFGTKASGAAPASSGGEDSVIGRVFGPQRDVNVTSTIGVRGLDSEDLRQAHFNSEQMKLLDGYALSKGAAEKSARGKGLSAAQVDYLEAASR